MSSQLTNYIKLKNKHFYIVEYQMFEITKNKSRKQNSKSDFFYIKWYKFII